MFLAIWYMYMYIVHACVYRMCIIIHVHIYYCVLQGSWRKVVVTDQLPVRPVQPSHQPTTADSGEGGGGEGERDERVVLLPRTANTSELWPAILTKAILKVAALE